MKRLTRLAFLLLCEEDEMIWQLQHGNPADFDVAAKRAKHLKAVIIRRFVIPQLAVPSRGSA